jgi:hypothetical protein
MRWGVQFALPFPPVGVTVFCRDSFGREAAGAARTFAERRKDSVAA